MEVDNVMLTTIDNPFSPFTEFDSWNRFDQEHGYNTLAYLARICIMSEELVDLDESQAIDNAIEEILQYNLNGLYKKIVV